MLRVCQLSASIVQTVERRLLLLVITDLSLCMIKCCSVVFGRTLRLLVTHFVVVSRQSTNSAAYLSVTTCGTVVLRRRIDDRWPAAALTPRSEARCWLRIAISAYPTLPALGSLHWNIAMPFGMEKLEWLGYPTVKFF